MMSRTQKAITAWVVRSDIRLACSFPQRLMKV
jgi:hypothetical protein